MRVRRWTPIASIVIALLAVGLASGCGGSSSGSTGGSGSGSTADAGSTEGTGGSKAPAAGFSKKAKQVRYGEESNDEEREQASQILEENLQARATGDYVTQCNTLSPVVVKAIEGNGSSAVKKRNCAETLGSEAAKAPPGLLENTMTEPISALRVKGPVAYALYHGKGGKDYSMKMEINGTKWLVGATLTEEIPPG